MQAAGRHTPSMVASELTSGPYRDPSPAARPRKEAGGSGKHRSSSLTSLPQSKPGSGVRRCSPEGVRGQKPPVPREKRVSHNVCGKP